MSYLTRLHLFFSAADSRSMAVRRRISMVLISTVVACTNDTSGEHDDRTTGAPATVGSDTSGTGGPPPISTGTFTTAGESSSSTTFVDGGLDDAGPDDGESSESGTPSPGELSCDEGCG